MLIQLSHRTLITAFVLHFLVEVNWALLSLGGTTLTKVFAIVLTRLRSYLLCDVVEILSLLLNGLDIRLLLFLHVVESLLEAIVFYVLNETILNVFRVHSHKRVCITFLFGRSRYILSFVYCILFFLFFVQVKVRLDMLYLWETA